MSIWGALEQLGQQPDPEKVTPKQPLSGDLGMLANKPQQPPLLGSSSDLEQNQQFGLLSEFIKEELGNG